MGKALPSRLSVYTLPVTQPSACGPHHTGEDSVLRQWPPEPHSHPVRDRLGLSASLDHSLHFLTQDQLFCVSDQAATYQTACLVLPQPLTCCAALGGDFASLGLSCLF